MLIATALVFLMTPGLALFYGGMVSQNNVINTHMLSWITIGLVGLHWVLFGYTFSFGSGTPGYGNFDFVALEGVSTAPNMDYAPTIPHILFMVYQMTFAIISAALISGAVVERMKMSSYVVFILIWTTIVYDLVAHWVWSAWTEIQNDGTSVVRFGWLRELGALDFAGGNVVHITSGFSALAASILVGKRRVWNKETSHTVTPHNVPMLLSGAAFLWFGWFGFNAGSALGSTDIASIAFVNTQIAAFSAMTTWAFLDATFLHRFGSFTATGAATGAVVGLVVITPCAGFVKPILSIPIGIIGSACSFGALALKRKVYIIDDTLDAFACHGVGGVVGSLLLGFFASKEVNPLGNDGVFYGNPILLAYQLTAVVVTAAISFGFTFIVLLALKVTMGLRIEDISKEVVGMDKISHDELGYNYEPLKAKEPEEIIEAVTEDGYKMSIEEPSLSDKTLKKTDGWLFIKIRKYFKR